MSGKTVMYEHIVFTPLEIQRKDAYAWNYDFYENLMLSEIPNDDKITWLRDVKPEPKPKDKDNTESKEVNKKGTANLSRRDDLITMTVISKDGSHTYETDNAARMEQVARELYETNSSVKWSICNKVQHVPI